MGYFVLYESAYGFALFEKKDTEEIGDQLAEVQEAVVDFKKFSKALHLKAFQPFQSSEQALENANSVSEGVLPDFLKAFLETNLPKNKKNVLGVAEEKLGSAIQEGCSVKCEKTTNVLEILRGVRVHFETYLKSVAGDSVRPADLTTAQRGLGHSYSRAKVKFNVNKADNMIIQSISLLDQLDKDINTFAMRVREWYSWHFPELIKIVPDNITYARIVAVLKSRANASEEMVATIDEIIGDADKSREVIHAARTSMGTDISEVDMSSIELFATRVVKLAEYRKNLQDYLYQRMHDVAPNLSTLIGETVGARLINHAGSLTNLAKYPASTVQILGAEKALFRALKTRGNTPKYGLIFNSTWIGKAKPKDKGRISRYLANKCSIAARIDSFSDEKASNAFGEQLKKQMEERLRFYETGQAPRKNLDVMQEAIAAAGGEPATTSTADAKKSKKNDLDDDEMETETPKKEKKEKKKEKKDRKKSKDDDDAMDTSEGDKKKDKKKKDKKDKKERKSKA